MRSSPFELTDDDTSDTAMIGSLVAASGGNIRAVIADEAYDGEPTPHRELDPICSRLMHIIFQLN